MPRVAVVRFPGSNCDFDTLSAASRYGAEAYFVWHRDRDLRGADIVILPGGFSYGDYLRSGAIARFSPIMQAVQRHAADGGPLLGICNGFQILCEAQLLPGALMRNAALSFVSKPVDVTVEQTDTAFTCDYEPGARLRLPVAHGEGRFTAAPDTLRMLEAEGRVVLRYVAATERSPFQPNPNGSANHIAGICNASGNIVGIMPHPERAADRLLGLTGGVAFFTSPISSYQAGPASGQPPTSGVSDR
jgi:phosphoribosylformylglycinamidine synthase I